jgi:peptidoglycan hydrolase CwlO-like protein
MKYIKKVWSFVLLGLAAVGAFFVSTLLRKKGLSDAKIKHDESKKETDEAYEDVRESVDSVKETINDIKESFDKHDQEVKENVIKTKEDMDILDNIELIKLGNEYLEKYGKRRDTND